MRVYHFVSAKHGLSNLENMRLKISIIMELNDPFEFLGADLSDRDFRKAIKETKKELSKTKGILCFSKNWSNPVQWSHYADRHRGICLGFDFPESNLAKVEYVKERLPHNGNIDEDLMYKFLTTKFEHWSYEEEYRAFLELEDRDADGNYYAEFSEALELKQVIIGAHSSITRKDVKNALSGYKEEIETFKARADFKRFEVVRNKNEKLWA
jgi:Ca2+-binding EF-hand superfamily protein